MMYPRHRCSEIAYPEHRFIIILRFFEMHTAGVLSYYFNSIFYYILRRFVNRNRRYCDWVALLRDEQILYDRNYMPTKTRF